MKQFLFLVFLTLFLYLPAKSQLGVQRSVRHAPVTNQDDKSWSYYKAEYNRGNRDADFLRGYIKKRTQITRIPPTYKLVQEYINAVPRGDLFSDAENRKYILDYALPGNDLYKLLKDNRKKFPELSDKEYRMQFFYSMLQKIKAESELLFGLAKSAIKSDFTRESKLGIEYYTINMLLNERKTDEFIQAYFKFVDKENIRADYSPSIATLILRSENQYVDFAEQLLPFLKERIDEKESPDFYSVLVYTYMLFKADRFEEAQRVAIRYRDLTNKYAYYSQYRWMYRMMKNIERGIQPQKWIY